MTSTRLPRYNKRCANPACGKLFGNDLASRLVRRKHCSRPCANTAPERQRSSRTLKVEELGRDTRLTTRQIAAIVELSQTQVVRILRRKRRETALTGPPKE